MKQLWIIALCLMYGNLQAQLWQDSYADAVKLAKTEEKPLVLVFSGSDWCAPCIRLKRIILESDEFKAHAEAHYILYNADFPRKKKNQLSTTKSEANRSLAEKYNPNGYFPLVIVLNGDEKVLGEAGFETVVPKEYISILNNFVR